MRSLAPVLRVGAALAALVISGFLVRKVVSGPTQPAPSDEGRNPGQKLGRDPGDDSFDGSSDPEAGDARREAAEAARVCTNPHINRTPIPRWLCLIIFKARARVLDRRAPGPLGRLPRQRGRKTMNKIIRQAAKDETGQRRQGRRGELWS